MSASSRGCHAATALLKRRPCLQSSSLSASPSPRIRYYSEAAAVQSAEAHHLKPHASQPQPPVTVSRRAEYKLKSGVVLSRPPLLTRTLHPFENAFFFYQKRLNERLVLPFRKTFYFKKDTAPDLDYNIKFRERGNVAAKELGAYQPSGRNAWNDELIVGSTLSSQERLQEALLKDAEMRVSEDGEVLKKSAEEAKDDAAMAEEDSRVVKPLDRVTDADKTGDVTRLDRELERTLYLVVKGKDGRWGFPTTDLKSDENLHQAAHRVLEESAGVNMNTWFVGRAPVAHHVSQPVFNEDTSIKQRGEKTFFLKARIMAGQADLKNNSAGYAEFQWLTKEELQRKLNDQLFSSIRNMFAAR